VILAGDHIYQMHYGTMVAFHKKNLADLTIGALMVTKEDARQFGAVG